MLQALIDSGRRLDIVTGCSIGALMASIVVGSRGDPVETLRELMLTRLDRLTPASREVVRAASAAGTQARVR